MSQSKLLLVAYDSPSSKRQRKMLELVRSQSSGGQKSAYECFLNQREVRLMSQSIQYFMLDDEDKVAFIPIRNEAPVALLGIAELPLDDGMIYLG